MELPKIYNAKLCLKDGTEIDILNPKLKYKKGNIHIRGLLDKNQFDDLNDFRIKLQMDKEFITNDDLLTIKAINGYNESITITKISYRNIGFASMKVEFVSYENLIDPICKTSKMEDCINAISIEGFKIMFKQSTHTNSKRVILNETRSIIGNSKKDYSEHTLNFRRNEVEYSLNITFIQSSEDDEIINLVIENKTGLDLLVYNEIKNQLRAFLSFPTGNTLVFRKEFLTMNSYFYEKYFSWRKVKQKVYSDYVPIVEHVSKQDVLQDYLNCFDYFLIMDEFFDLTDVIFLFNEAKKTSIEGAIFLMLIAIEKLGNKFLSSPFNVNPRNFIINPSTFDALFSETKNRFDNDFQNIDKRSYDILKNKMRLLNQKGKTDRKIDELLDFCEIKRTNEINQLFPMLRNLAIHEGKTNHPNGDSYSHYKTLKNLLHDIMLNLIQYKGYRYLGRIDGTKRVTYKENFNLNLESYR
jgi:hypothetical protein